MLLSEYSPVDARSPRTNASCQVEDEHGAKLYPDFFGRVMDAKNVLRSHAQVFPSLFKSVQISFTKVRRLYFSFSPSPRNHLFPKRAFRPELARISYPAGRRGEAQRPLGTRFAEQTAEQPLPEKQRPGRQTPTGPTTQRFRADAAGVLSLAYAARLPPRLVRLSTKTAMTISTMPSAREIQGLPVNPATT